MNLLPLLYVKEHEHAGEGAAGLCTVCLSVCISVLIIMPLLFSLHKVKSLLCSLSGTGCQIILE